MDDEDVLDVPMHEQDETSGRSEEQTAEPAAADRLREAKDRYARQTPSPLDEY